MKRLYAIWSILLVLLVSIAVVVPGCTPTTGTIEVDATLDGSPWTGAVDYTLTPESGSPVSGTSVDGTFTVDAGNWTCAYDGTGGPAGAHFIDITPSATQELSAGGTVGFTLNFVTPQQVDAFVTFDSWSINGTPVPGGATYWVGPGAIIDATYKEGVSGNNTGQPVTVHETSWLTVHNTGTEGNGEAGPVIKLHVVNGLGAVKTDPPSDVSNQQATVEGVPKPFCYSFDLPVCQEVHLDAEADLEQEVGTNYTKTINWLEVPEGVVILQAGDVVFDVEEIGAFEMFTLVSYACVEVEAGFEDTNPSNDCCVASSMITIGFNP
ncbi:MAG: hypothetical protein U9M91_02495 [Chloroflexota bacterium]|nr:hypothetical protein [Chloroflexota bacterium]